MNLTKASTYDWRNLGAQVNPPRIGKGKIYKFAQVSPEIRKRPLTATLTGPAIPFGELIRLGSLCSREAGRQSD